MEEQCRAQEHLVNYALMTKIIYAKEPKCLEEALGDDRWMESMQSEHGSIMKNNTWDLVDCPSKCKIIGTNKCIYKTKYKSDRSLLSTKHNSWQMVLHKYRVMIIHIPLLPQHN